MHTMARTRAHARRRPVPWPEALLFALWLVAAVLIGDGLRDVDRATFVVRNDTPWELGLAVQDGDASMPVTIVDRQHAKQLTEVPVPGSTWQLVWLFEGDVVGRSTVDDDDLQRPGYELRVPADVAAALRDAGAAPSP